MRYIYLFKIWTDNPGVHQFDGLINMVDTNHMNEIKPLIPESNFSESTSVVTILDQLDDNTLRIPDYQRDSDQWDEITKSLFVESVINNLRASGKYITFTNLT
jgi:hypothetical protein